MCVCQTYGKSGVPNAQGKCLVCGEPVDPQGAVITGTELTPDDLAELETTEAELRAQLTSGLVEDRCQVCGRLIGIGIPLLHLGLCEACRDTTES